MHRKALLFSVALMCVALTSVSARAMSVDYLQSFNDTGYRPPYALFNVAGRPIDQSYAGVTIFVPENTSYNFDLNNPNGQTESWYAYAAIQRVGENNTMAILVPPYDITVWLVCGNYGGEYQLSTSSPEYTWSAGWQLWELDYTNELMEHFADQSYSPTGRDLYVGDVVCSVRPEGLQGNDTLILAFWAQAPDRSAVCNIDESVLYMQASVVQVIDYNMQVWQIMFQIFTLVVIIGAVFGIPLLIYKLIRYVIHEFKGKEKRI